MLNCSFGPKRQDSFVLPPGAVEVVECLIRATTPGEFDVELHLFVADPNTRDVVIHFYGTAQASP
jgi:hypothetical protein